MAATALPPITNPQMTELQPSPSQRLLVIAENRALQRTLRRLFSSEGYEVETVADDRLDLEMLRKTPPSALILGLESISMGWEICREIAQSSPSLPFIVLSANSDVVDKIIVLEIGADDYLSLPFQPRELLARLRSLIRRATGANRPKTYVFENVVVDLARMDVTREGARVLLTAKEFKTLEFLMKHTHRVISRGELLNEVWGYQNYPCTRTVDNHIFRLRQKLENDPSNPRHFLTIHGVGYKFAP